MKGERRQPVRGTQALLVTVIKIVLASRNKHKVAELKTLLKENIKADFELLSLDEVGITEEIEEDGATFEENSVIKASSAAKLGYACIADDSGLSVDCLGGAPGVYSARYAGEPCDNDANNAKLLREVRNEENRTARFVCVMSLVAPEGCGLSVPESLSASDSLVSLAEKKSGRKVGVLSVRGEAEGEIIDELRGSGGFGYDPLFYFPKYGKTFAQLSPEEKNGVSHRGRAIAEFAKAVNDIFEKADC